MIKEFCIEIEVGEARPESFFSSFPASFFVAVLSSLIVWPFFMVIVAPFYKVFLSGDGDSSSILVGDFYN